ncbi:MAG: EAL domain-containing protein, partial [Gammaproteobacteria bacterium]|nr:EAL domain-containing protein [Gammaproteobacteria bacterium]
TGYSSLSALQQFPIDTLKIDQSFVRDVGENAGNATLVRTIIEMGRNLEIDVIAEGVESVGQLEFLRRNGCHYAQGRLFGEPLKAEELLALLQRQATSGAAFRRYTQDSGAVVAGEPAR